MLAAAATPRSWRSKCYPGAKKWVRVINRSRIHFSKLCGRSMQSCGRQLTQEVARRCASYAQRSGLLSNRSPTRVVSQSSPRARHCCSTLFFKTIKLPTLVCQEQAVMTPSFVCEAANKARRLSAAISRERFVKASPASLCCQ